MVENSVNFLQLKIMWLHLAAHAAASFTNDFTAALLAVVINLNVWQVPCAATPREPISMLKKLTEYPTCSMSAMRRWYLSLFRL